MCYPCTLGTLHWNPNTTNLLIFAASAFDIPQPSNYSRVSSSQAMPLHQVAFGRFPELGEAATLRAGIAELIATFIFVFIGEGSTIAFGMWWQEPTSLTKLYSFGLLELRWYHKKIDSMSLLWHYHRFMYINCIYTWVRARSRVRVRVREHLSSSSSNTKDMWSPIS